jgi:hypothetical protein
MRSSHRLLIIKDPTGYGYSTFHQFVNTQFLYKSLVWRFFGNIRSVKAECETMTIIMDAWSALRVLASQTPGSCLRIPFEASGVCSGFI